jgi:hypothetical protein
MFRGPLCLGVEHLCEASTERLVTDTVDAAARVAVAIFGASSTHAVGLLARRVGRARGVTCARHRLAALCCSARGQRVRTRRLSAAAGDAGAVAACARRAVLVRSADTAFADASGATAMGFGAWAIRIRQALETETDQLRSAGANRTARRGGSRTVCAGRTLRARPQVADAGRRNVGRSHGAIGARLARHPPPKRGLRLGTTAALSAPASGTATRRGWCLSGRQALTLGPNRRAEVALRTIGGGVAPACCTGGAAATWGAAAAHTSSSATTAG